MNVEWASLVVAGMLSLAVVSAAVGSGRADAQTAPAEPVSTPIPTNPVSQTVATDETDGVASNESQGGAKNIVQIRNRIDGRLRVKANVQLHRDNGTSASPVNIALATGSCSDCQTFAVALQMALVDMSGSVVAPQNAAVAVNEGCTRCVTVARAIQYVFPLDDTYDLPPRAKQLAQQMDQQLQDIHTNGMSVGDAEQRVESVIAQFADLADRVIDQRDERTDDQPSTGATTTATVASPSATAEAITVTLSPTADLATAAPSATPDMPIPSPSSTPEIVTATPLATGTTQPTLSPATMPSPTAG